MNKIQVSMNQGKQTHCILGQLMLTRYEQSSKKHAYLCNPIVHTSMNIFTPFATNAHGRNTTKINAI